MALTPGTRLGPYAITAQIGVGGMGEVYRATDTNLDRAEALLACNVLNQMTDLGRPQSYSIGR